MITWLLAGALFSGPVTLDKISSAEMCGRCHRDILRAWKTSVHAEALEDPLFQDALDLAVTEFGVQARSGCLKCHAPTVQYSSDTALVKKVTWEGVTCDFCHSLKSVSVVSGLPRLLVEFDGVKTGPLKDALSGAHGVAFSPVHTSSLVCAGCHEYRNAAGLAVLTTYSEWEASSYAAKQTHCQSCHMAAMSANVVDPKIKRVKETTVNLHQMPGSHSIEQLNKAIGARLTLARENGMLKVNVEVSNRGAGHMVPTGSPLRQVHLELRVLDASGKSYQGERVYTRKVVDRQGRELAAEHEVFVEAARVKEDTRLKAGERRVESFTFPLPPGVSANVRAQLWYYYSPLAQIEQQKKVSFLTLAQYAAP
ncbi:MAG: hypothetical protein HY238_18420 [Acidobacteria bacterium]|nr:hypothetical protein [Acidobacteriota bacterium]